MYLGAEVNLVADCLHNASCGNVVREALPRVALDYVSYSSYDSMRYRLCTPTPTPSGVSLRPTPPPHSTVCTAQCTRFALLLQLPEVRSLMVQCVL